MLHLQSDTETACDIETIATATTTTTKAIANACNSDGSGSNGGGGCSDFMAIRSTNSISNCGSPIGARRMRTDLKTSDNVFLSTYPLVRRPRSRNTSPQQQHVHQQHQQQVNQAHNAAQHHINQLHSQQQQQQQHQQHLYTGNMLPQRRHWRHSKHAAATLSHDNSVASGDVAQHALKQQVAKHRATTTTATAAVNVSRPHAIANALNAKETNREDNSNGDCDGGDDDEHSYSDGLHRLSSSAPYTSMSYLSAKLPARATRLLNRSRLQQQQQHQLHQHQQRQLTQCPSMFGSLTVSTQSVAATAGAAAIATAAADSDSSRSPHSLRRSQASSRASSVSVNHISANRQRSHHHHHHHHQQQHLHQQHRDSYSSSDDLMLYDKSFRNAMIQDVLQFKKQLLRLRRILQETETLNPFENDNGKLFATCGLDSKQLDDIDLASLTSSITDDPVQELAELRRQVVYLQSQVDDRDRTIRLQRNLIEKLEAEKKALSTNGETPKECISMATQTERTRPLSVAAEGLSRSKPQYTSYTTHFPLNLIESTTVIQEQHQPEQQQQLDINNQKKTRRHTIISTTLTNYNHQVANGATGSNNCTTPRRASIAWENQAKQSIPIYKPVRITLIGEPLKLLNTENTRTEAGWTNHKCELKDAVIPNGITSGGVSGNGDKMLNGNSGNSINGDFTHVYQQLDNNIKSSRANVRTNTLQHQQQQQQQQKHLILHNRTQSNGNLYPTVTIV